MEIDPCYPHPAGFTLGETDMYDAIIPAAWRWPLTVCLLALLAVGARSCELHTDMVIACIEAGNQVVKGQCISR